eukprot:9308233-Pyramimonas_sp.AAC.1
MVYVLLRACGRLRKFERASGAWAAGWGRRGPRGDGLHLHNCAQVRGLEQGPASQRLLGGTPSPSGLARLAGKLEIRGGLHLSIGKRVRVAMER